MHMSTISGIYTGWLTSSEELSDDITIFISYTNSTIVNNDHDVEEAITGKT